MLLNEANDRHRRSPSVVKSMETDPAASPTSGFEVLIMINTTTEQDGQPWESLNSDKISSFPPNRDFPSEFSDLQG